VPFDGAYKRCLSRLDHVKSLACGGPDAVSNMLTGWLSLSDRTTPDSVKRCARSPSSGVGSPLVPRPAAATRLPEFAT
jgi:hypothetical protein